MIVIFSRKTTPHAHDAIEVESSPDQVLDFNVLFNSAITELHDADRCRAMLNRIDQLKSDTDCFQYDGEVWRFSFSFKTVAINFMAGERYGEIFPTKFVHDFLVAWLEFLASTDLNCFRRFSVNLQLD
jgi:hypothetical protein